MNLTNVIIEVTRRCNMECSHCLRGNQENCDINTNYIDALLEKVDYIDNITFTGGEPSLVPNIIQYTIDKAKQLNVSFGGFYIVTNGKIVPDAFLLAIMDLYFYCDDKDMCTLSISNDGYHIEDDNTLSENWEKLSVFKFTEKREGDGDYYNRRLVPEGRGLNYTSKDKEYYIKEFENIDEDFIDGTIYLNCKGNILSDCDLSYKTQENKLLIIGNILDIDFEKDCNRFQEWLNSIETTSLNDILDMEQEIIGKVA